MQSTTVNVEVPAEEKLASISLDDKNSTILKILEKPEEKG